MSTDRTTIDLGDVEYVDIWSLDPPVKLVQGTLTLGTHGIPQCRWGTGEGVYPWTFPSNWNLRPQMPAREPGPLLDAWRKIEEVMSELAIWKRRHDGMGREEANVKEEKRHGDVDEAAL